MTLKIFMKVLRVWGVHSNGYGHGDSRPPVWRFYILRMCVCVCVVKPSTCFRLCRHGNGGLIAIIAWRYFAGDILLTIFFSEPFSIRLRRKILHKNTNFLRLGSTGIVTVNNDVSSYLSHKFVLLNTEYLNFLFWYIIIITLY